MSAKAGATECRIILSLAMVLQLGLFGYSGALASDTARLTKTVNRLGLESPDPAYGFALLAEQPHEAVALLINQLHPIAHRAYFEGHKTDQSKHVIACLRALRYLTGHCYCASTKFKLSDDERQFLDFDKAMHDNNPSHKIHFFGVWMSRNAEFVAPKDAQLAIIDEWKHFLQAEGKSFEYRPPTAAASAMDDWFWFG